MRVLLLIFLLGLPVESLSQKIKPLKVGRLPSTVRESSGLAISGHNCLWTINDSGGGNRLFQITNSNPSGNFIGERQCNNEMILNNAVNTDWEDLTRDDSGNIYVGDFGNNVNRRKNLSIYKLILADSLYQPAIHSSDEPLSFEAENITFRYADQALFPPPPSNWNFDCEAFFHMDDSLYLFSRNISNPNDGYTKMYRLPDQPGTYVAQLVDSFLMKEPVTGAAISPDGHTVVLLTYFSLWVCRDFPGSNFFSGKVFHFHFKGFTQKEAIVFGNNDLLYITDERNFAGGKLYTIDLKTLEFGSPAVKTQSTFFKRAIYNFFNNPKRAYHRIRNRENNS